MSRLEHRRLRRAAWVAVALALGTAAGTARAAGPQVCVGVPAPTVSRVATDTALSTMFTSYGNSGDGWTGADSTWSAAHRPLNNNSLSGGIGASWSVCLRLSQLTLPGGRVQAGSA